MTPPQPPREEPSPDVEPETTTDPAAASSGDSSTSSSSPFVGSTGPGFDPEATAEQLRPEVPELAPVIPEVSEEQVRSALYTGGDGLHAVIGVGELDWVMTERDLDRLTAPLTRIVNRHEQLRAVAARSDEAAVAIGVGLYSWRSMLERGAVLEARRGAAGEPEPQPVVDPGEPPAGAAVVETPAGFTTAADRIRASRPEE